jgi:hypothetical protein
MEARRRLRKNKIIIDIRDAELFLTRSKETIQRIKTSQMGEVYIRNQIDKLKDGIIQKDLFLNELREELVNLAAGCLDEDINQEYKDNEKKFKKQKLESAKNKAIKKEALIEKKQVSENYWKGIISASRDHKQKDRDVKYAFKYSNSVNDSLPEYMKNNLEEMPNNKGYIWRGVYFYGYLREQQGPRVMFEKQRGGILVIHEYTDREYKRYEKKGKERKILVHSQLKKPKRLGVDLMDYVVKK